jgi:hypothetical protein
MEPVAANKNILMNEIRDPNSYITIKEFLNDNGIE